MNACLMPQKGVMMQLMGAITVMDFLRSECRELRSFEQRHPQLDVLVLKPRALHFQKVVGDVRLDIGIVLELTPK